MSARSTEVAAWLRAARRRARPPGAADARQPGRAVGDHARLHEARRRGHPRDDAADRGGHHRPGRAGPRVARRDRAGVHGRVRAGARRLHAASSSAAACPGWTDYPAAGRADADGPLDLALEQGVTRGDDTLLLYFTSGRRPSPSWSSTRTCPTRSGTCRRCTGSACAPATCTSTSPPPGWAKHAWSSFFAPWNAEATILVVNQARFDAARLLETMAAAGATTFCAPPTVYRMLIQQDLARVARPALAARDGRRRRAAEPRGDRPGPRRAGPHHPRRLRPDRDHPAGRQLPGPGGRARARWAASCPATTWCCSTPRPARSARAPEPRASCACGCPGPADARSG